MLQYIHILVQNVQLNLRKSAAVFVKHSHNLFAL